MKAKVYIGPAGWMYDDWEGIVYPLPTEPKFDPLVSLTQYFNLVEVNSSFYRPPTQQTTLKWVERVKKSPDFIFTYKLWQAYTHHRESSPGAQDEKLVKQGLDVLKKHDRLGAVLMQFPWSFKNMPENQSWLKKLLTIYREYNPVVEVRHNSWNNDDFLTFLKDHGAAFANIDQPVIGNSIGLTSFASDKLSYLRLHGRNFKNWFAKDASVTSRYNYLYSEQELKSIIKTIENLIENSSKTFIIFNNHYRGQAVVNALQTIFLLSGNRVNAPLSLVQTYPELQRIVKSDDKNNEQASLL